MMSFLREGKIKPLVRIIKNIKEKVPDGETFVVRALQTKSVKDGRNMLMQAAAYGKKNDFLTLVNALLERVSVKCYSSVPPVTVVMLFANRQNKCGQSISPIIPL